MLFDIDLLSSCLGRSSIFEGLKQEDLLLEVTAEMGLWYGLLELLLDSYYNDIYARQRVAEKGAVHTEFVIFHMAAMHGDTSLTIPINF